MQKSYAVSVFLNIILSLLFIAAFIIGLSTAGKKNMEDWGFFIYFMLVFVVFLWLSFRCFKLNKYNTGLISIKKRQRVLGKTVAVTAVVLAVTLLVISTAGFFVFTNEATKDQLRYSWVYVLLLCLLLVAALTAILNAVYYFNALKKNTALVSDYINAIGT